MIEGPVEFRMGSPPTEPERFSDEILHRRIIPRRFAIATKEVTVEQYQEFVKENPVDDHANNDRYSPDPKGPMNGVSWYHAAAYCNWLSRKENLPECYEPNDRGQYAEGMKTQGHRIKIGGLGRMANSAFGGKLNLCGTCSHLFTMFVVYLVVDNKYNVYVR